MATSFALSLEARQACVHAGTGPFCVQVLCAYPAMTVLEIRVEEAGVPRGSEKGMLLTTGFPKGARINSFELAGQVCSDWHIWSAAQLLACNLWLGFSPALAPLHPLPQPLYGKAIGWLN